jgi:nucleoid-associated protein EbfC
MFDRAKTLIELKKIQSALAKETVEAESGNGALRVKMNGEMKIKEVKLDPTKYDPNDTERLEKLIESAVAQALTLSQQVAAEKMKSVSGGLGLPGL